MMDPHELSRRDMTLTLSRSLGIGLAASSVGTKLEDAPLVGRAREIRLSSYTKGSVDLAPIINTITSNGTAGAAVDMLIDVPGVFGGPVNFSQMGRYRFGPYTYLFTDPSARILIGPYKDVEISGAGVRATRLKATSAVDGLFHVIGYEPSGVLLNERRMIIRDLNLDGGGVGLRGFSSEPSAYPTQESMSIFHIFDSVEVHDWMVGGIETGKSEFYGVVQFCQFWANNIGLHTGEFSDMAVLYNVFAAPRGSSGSYVTHGCQQRITGNSFLRPSPGATPGDGPDIEIRSSAAGSGTIMLQGNYFGSEEERPNRPKILIGDKTHPTSIVADVMLSSNWFYGVDGQTAIRIDNPTSNIVIDETNIFHSFSVVIDDNCDPGRSGGVEGHNAFKGKVVSGPGSDRTCALFVNGGRGFDDVVYPPQAKGFAAGQPRLNNYGAAQRLRKVADWTSAADAYSWGGTVAYRGGQADPFGGATAVLIAKGGGQPFAQAAKRIVTTNLKTDTGEPARGATGRVVVDFWAKAGALATLDFALYDETRNRTVTSYHLTLSSAWQPYRFVLTGLDGANTTKLLWYPGRSGGAAGGTVYLSHVQVSDVGADFTLTPTFP